MNNCLEEHLQIYFDEVSPTEFYRDIFPAGELEGKGEYVNGRYTGIIVAVTGERLPNGRTKIKRYNVTDELEAVEAAAASDDFCLCSPISYAGKSRTADNARNMYAIAVDLDRIRITPEGEPVGLVNLWERHIMNVGRIPKPTYIVSSGTGLHLYYVFKKPIPLFRNTARELQEYKRELTRLIWHDTIADIRSIKDVQQEGIYQGFRMPGTITKAGGRARAFLTGEKVSMEYLNGFVHERYQVKSFAYKSALSLSQAAARYPEWYERRIMKGEPKKTWATNRAVYDWWKRQILDGVTVGHRYYCVMMLAIYARKCSVYDPKHNPNPVTREELEADCFALVDLFDSITTEEDNHFGNDDVLDALEAFDDRWVTYPRGAIEYRSGIAIQANKRNGQRQGDHLEEARAIRDIRARRKGTAWDAHNGRKSKADAVKEWRRTHPGGRKVDCIRDTGISKGTVYKHWDE